MTRVTKILEIIQMPLHNHEFLGQPILAQLVEEAGAQGKSQLEVCVEKLESEVRLGLDWQRSC